MLTNFQLHGRIPFSGLLIPACLQPPKRRKLSTSTTKAVATPPSKPPSKAITQLSSIAPKHARATLQRLTDGYRDKSGSGYPAATTNATGCVLVQKVTNRTQNGYIQITPISLATTGPRTGTRNGTTKDASDELAPQNAHRLVVIAHKRYTILAPSALVLNQLT
jgi:hypothetical protein